MKIRNWMMSLTTVFLGVVVMALIAGGAWPVLAQDGEQGENAEQLTHQVFVPLISSAGQDTQVADTAAAQVVTSDQFEALRHKVSQTGSVMVIVGLASRGGFLPEGDLSSPAAITDQRGAIAQAQQALLSSLAQHKVNAYATYQTVPAIAMKVDAAGLRALRNSLLVTSLKEDIPDAPTLASSTAVIGAPTAWAAGYEGAGQTVAILDTGIDGDHPFFGSRIVAQACFSSAGGTIGVTLCPNGNASQTGSGAAEAQITACNNGSLCKHGSHVAGIAAGDGASFDGVARKTNIIAIQVFTRLNSASDCSPFPAPCVLSYPSDRIAGLDYINATLSANYNVAAANISIGSGNYTNQAQCDADNASEKTAIDNLRSKNIATVIASGNNDLVNGISAPACISTAVAVGATTDADAVASFSNMHAMVDLLAPGVSIDSSIPGGGFDNLQGTSMAAPHVAGAWAILKAVNPVASVSTILSTLQSTGLNVTDTRSGGTVTKPRIRLDQAIIPQVPPAATLISPHGSISDTTPELKWNKVSSSTWYYLWVSDASGNVYAQWYTAATLGCSTASSTVCSITLNMNPGTYRWWVQTWNSTGYGPWSSFLTFTVTSLGATTLVAPSGNISDNTPTFSWQKVSGATWYYLWVNNSSGNIYKQWYPSSSVCGSTTCSVTPISISPGSHRWWVQTYGSGVYGPWSSSLTFTLLNNNPGTVTLYAPSGATTDTTPTFTWSRDSNATWYQIWVSNSAGTKLFSQWYTSAQAGCSSASSTVCFITPGTVSNSSYIFWVQTYGNGLYGPWSAPSYFQVVTVSTQVTEEGMENAMASTTLDDAQAVQQFQILDTDIVAGDTSGMPADTTSPFDATAAAANELDIVEISAPADPFAAITVEMPAGEMAEAPDAASYRSIEMTAPTTENTPPPGTEADNLDGETLDKNLYLPTITNN